MKKLVVIVLVGWGLASVNAPSYAGVPFNNLEGVGGIAFNPLAYTAGNKTEDFNNHGKFSFDNFITSKPQVGTWYVALPQTKIDWATGSIAQTFFNRLEISYGFENVQVPNLQHIEKNSFGLKALLLEEKDYLPAISAGTIFKHTNFDTPKGVSNEGVDAYVVATKLIKHTFPLPVLISGGILSTKGRTTGVLGFDKNRDELFFGNIDVLPLENVAVGIEYRQGAHYHDFKDSDYWDVHLAWFVNKNFSLALAYVNTGDPKSKVKTGLGDGVVLSAQYAF
jgi:hypothetical protein